MRPIRDARGRGVEASDRGQASVELVAALPLMLLLALILFQLGAIGYAYMLTDGAAEAGALALAAGRPPGPAVRAGMPRWARERIQVRASATRVEVTARPPSPLGFLSDRLQVRSTASVVRGGQP